MGKLAVPLRHKYGNVPTERDGIRFASKREARRYDELVLLQRQGVVRFFLRQVPLHIPGGVRYVLDFLVFWSDGEITWEDVKGRATALYKTKKKLVEHHYPITITEL